MTTRSDIDVVRRLYDAFEDGDHDGVRQCLAEDLRWRQAGSSVPAADEEVVGREALMARVIGHFDHEWDGFSEEVEDLFAADGNVVATGTYRGTHRGSGRQLEAEFCHLWRVEDGLIRGFRQYTDTAAFAEVFSRQHQDAS